MFILGDEKILDYTERYQKILDGQFMEYDISLSDEIDALDLLYRDMDMLGTLKHNIFANEL